MSIDGTGADGPLVRSARVPGEAAAGHFVVVPRTPGRLADLGAAKGRPRDELDEFIDEVFGRSTDERPGLFDAVLVIVGLALAGWGVFLGGPAIAGWLGVFAVLLGVALPVRGAIRGYMARRSRAARQRAVGDGIVLDTSHPTTADLAEAYERLLDASRLPSIREPNRIAAAGHMAMMEAASLLDGGPPVADEQVVYVGRRTQALRSLTAQLLGAHERWLQSARADMKARSAEDREWAAAVTAAREELEASLRTGSLTELDLLRDELRDAPDAGA